MAIDLQQDWPAYVLLGGVIIFFGYIIIKGNHGQEARKDEQPHEKGKK